MMIIRELRIRRETMTVCTFDSGVDWHGNVAVALRVVRRQVMSRRLGMLRRARRVGHRGGRGFLVCRRTDAKAAVRHLQIVSRSVTSR